METYEFELLVEGLDVDDDKQLDVLYGRADDATASTDGRVWWVGFDREAEDLLAAITSAITDVEAGGDIKVLRVMPDEYVRASEIAERLGRSRQSIDLLVRGKRGPGDFPPPAAESARNPLWRWDEVAAWFARYEGAGSSKDEPSTVVAVINGVLEARRHLGRSPQPALRTAARRLLAS